MTPSITIIISTFNRADVLRQTLADIDRVDRTGLDVHLIVINNNSADHTQDVLTDAEPTLSIPFTHFIEPTPGRATAVNTALQRGELRDLILFSDDDVTPDPDWLHNVARSATDWPDHDVFGGRVLPTFPSDRVPAWANFRWIQVFGFALHDLPQPEGPYPADAHPFGPNFWVRRSIIDAGFRFNAVVGPRPDNRVMGGETVFLNELSAAGHHAVYVPSALIHHRIQPDALEFAAIQRRAVRFGRGNVHSLGTPDPHAAHTRPLRWRCGRLAALARESARYVSTIGRTRHADIASRRVYAIAQFAYHREALKLHASNGHASPHASTTRLETGATAPSPTRDATPDP